MGDWTRVLRGYGLMGTMRAPVWSSPRRFARLPGRITGTRSSMCSALMFSNAHTPLPPLPSRGGRRRMEHASRYPTSGYRKATNAPRRRPSQPAPGACRTSATPSVGAFDRLWRTPPEYLAHNGWSWADQAPDRAQQAEALLEESPCRRRPRVLHAARHPHPLLRIQPGAR